MKKLLLATSAFVALAYAPANAADLGQRMVTKAPPPVEAFSWAGMYIGAHGGYGWGRHTLGDGLIGAGTETTVDPKGGFGGVQVGYNTYLSRNWVLGSELDVSFGRIQGSTVNGGVLVDSNTDYFGTARARLGYASGEWLIYGTAGTAWTHTKTLATAGGFYARDEFLMGWTVGGGVEYALNRNWSVKAEYLYADLATNNLFNSNIAANEDSDLRVQMVRLGLNYRFDGSAPSAAAMPNYPVKARPMAVASWNGSYIGAHGGYGRGKMDVNDFGLGGPLGTDSLTPSGGFGGITTGYNWLLSSSWLVGLESETSFGSLKTNSISTGGFTSTGEIKYFGSERARLGYVAGDWLLYGTGGLAWAQAKYDAPALTTSYKQFQVGWAAGGGVEYMFMPNWSAKVEYLHSDYGTFDVTATGPIAQQVSLKSDTVKGGINYHGDILGALFR